MKFCYKNHCQAGGLAIIHKKNEPNLSRGQPAKYNFFKILHCSGDLQELICLDKKTSEFFSGNLTTLTHVFNYPFAHFMPDWFILLWQCENSPQKNNTGPHSSHPYIWTYTTQSKTLYWTSRLFQLNILCESMVTFMIVT